MTDNSPRAFISHSSEDSVFVRRFCEDLRSNGVDAWYSEWEIGPGDSIVQKVEEGLSEAEIFIVVLSESSVNRPWVHHELAVAMIRKLKGLTRRLIPVRMDKCEIPEILRPLLWEDLSGDNYEKGLASVLNTVFEVQSKPPIGKRWAGLPHGRSRVVPIADLERRLADIAPLVHHSEAGALALRFVSKKWGFGIDMVLPSEMSCATLARTLIEGLDLQQGLDLPKTGERIIVFWQLENEAGDLLTPDISLRSAGFREGDRVFLHATIKQQDVRYMRDRDGAPLGMTLGEIVDLDDWRA